MSKSGFAGVRADDDARWRETVRDLYDDLHFGEDNLFTGNRLARRLIGFIESRHPSFFNEPHDGPKATTPRTLGDQGAETNDE